MHRVPTHSRAPWYGSWRLIVAAVLTVVLFVVTLTLLISAVESLMWDALAPLCGADRAGTAPAARTCD